VISKWFEYKEKARELRKLGVSMTVIEREFGIPRSTLSGWFKDIPLTEAARTQLMKNRQDGWKKARQKAVLTHNAQKQARLEAAEQAASATIAQLSSTNATLDLALAMLYLGEGAKNNATSIANSNPMVLRFVLAVLFNNYGLTSQDIRCDLHLRADQNGTALQHYWARELKLPIECFKYVAYDKRSRNKPTYEHYKGVCVITCNQIAIQRKLIAVYNQFCTKISDDILGA
tara:strand:- start:126 stop:818 length:693 start_codon:yes stop_codon:yes gene_type:complete